MAGVSAACIVPPLATGFSVIFGKKYYENSEKSAGYVNFLLGSTHITEGAIPFAAKRPLTIIPILMMGSAIAAILTYLLKVEVPAPHGGFIVLPVVTHPIFWVVAIVIGALVAGLLMAIEQKRHVLKTSKTNNKRVEARQVNQNQKDIIMPEQVFLNQNLETKEAILKYISNKAVQLEIADEQASILEGLKKREEESSTGMENGIAIPHVASEHIVTAKLIIVQIDHGIEWPSLDDQNTDFIISILVPKDNESKHLEILSQLSRKLIDESYIKELKNAKSKNQISQLIQGGIS